MSRSSSLGGTRTPRADRHPALLAVAAVLYLAGAAALLVDAPSLGNRVSVVVTAALFTCGALLVLRSDARVIGWLLVVPGVLFTVFYLIPGNGVEAPIDPTAWYRYLAPLTNLGVGCLVLLFLVFPDGRFPNGLARATGLVGIVTVVAQTVLDYLRVGGVEGLPDRRTTAFVVFAVFMVAVVIALAIQARLYRRRSRTAQLQMKWFLVAILGQFLFVVGFLLGIEGGTLAFAVLDNVATSLFPVTILVAVSRYRLYEVDRIISRTVAYAIVIGSLAVLGIGGVTAITALLPTRDRLAVALSTIAVVALFDPLRRRVTDLVDRRFDRTRYVAQQVVEDFGRQVQDVTDPAEVVERVHTVAGTTLAPATIAVWQPRTGASS